MGSLQDLTFTAKTLLNDEAGSNPLKDHLILEDVNNNPCANIIVIKKDSNNKEKVTKLVDVLQSKEVVNFIVNKYNCSILPVLK